jgi:hypothetical protein
MTTQGQPKFTGLAIGEITVNRLNAALRMEAKAAFINTRTGQTHGWTTGNQWTPPTLAKLNELLTLMEEDMARTHFEQGEAATTQTATNVNGNTPRGGLGEYITDPTDIQI